jgi:hypothetical protein
MVYAPQKEGDTMARTAKARTTKRKTPRKVARSGLNPARLPYASETQAANDALEFLFDRLPTYIASELRNIDIAVDEANLYRELSSLSDATLKQAGLKRSDLPALVASAFHLIRLSNGRAGRRPRRAAAQRKAKRTVAKRKAPRRRTSRA